MLYEYCNEKYISHNSLQTNLVQINVVQIAVRSKTPLLRLSCFLFSDQ